MAEPQNAILPEAGAAARFVTLRVLDAHGRRADVARALAAFPALVDEVAVWGESDRLQGSVAVGAGLWNVLAPDEGPRELVPFPTVGDGWLRVEPTAADVLLHIHGARADLCFELLHRAMRGIGDAVEVVEDVEGWRYLDSRDLTGFIDGTENPGGDERAEVALIGAEDVAFEGGSYVIGMRFVHDLDAWARQPRAKQEAAIGRTKADSVELDDKPETAHISRVVIEEDGKELEIVRHSMPYGGAREAGLFFLAYARHLTIFQKMLDRMYAASGDGMHDDLMVFTRAVSGGYFFAPSRERLASLV